MKRTLTPIITASVLFSPMLFNSTAKAVTYPTVEYSAGHADIGVAYEGGELDLHYHFGTDTVLDGVYQGVESEYSTDDVYTRVPDSQSISRPAGSQWDFLGTTAGSTIWYLPQNNVAGLPFLGTAAEELTIGEWAGPITYTFDILDIPAGAEFSIWQTDFFGSPVVQIATSDGTPDTLAVPVGSHSHYNIGFTEPGVYQISLTATGTHNSGGEVTDEGTLWFAVGDNTVIPEPASLALMGLGGLMVIKRRRLA